MSKQDFEPSQVGSSAVGRATVFDRARFETVTMADSALQREVMGLFITQLEQTRVQVERGPITPEERKFLSHTLRGAAAAVGATEIEELAKTWETVGFDTKVLGVLLAQAETAFLELTQAYRE